MRRTKQILELWGSFLNPNYVKVLLRNNFTLKQFVKLYREAELCSVKETGEPNTLLFLKYTFSSLVSPGCESM